MTACRVLEVWSCFSQSVSQPESQPGNCVLPTVPRICLFPLQRVSGAGGDRVAVGNVFRREASVLMAAQLRAWKAQLIYSIAQFLLLLALSSATDRSLVYNQSIRQPVHPSINYQSINQSINQSVHPPVHPSINYQSINQSINQSVHPPVHPSINYQSISQSINQCIHLSVHPSINYQSINQCIHPSIHPSTINQSISASTCQSIHQLSISQSINQCIHLSVHPSINYLSINK